VTAPGTPAGELAGTVALVTGAGSGIGAAAARLLAERGLDVAVVARRAELLAETARAVEQAGRQAHVVVTDLAEPQACVDAVASTVEALGRLDVQVNNAAFIRNGPIEAHSVEIVDRHLAVNVRAPFLLTQAALPHLRRGELPAIVNVSSSVGSMVKPGSLLYGTSKAALEYFTRACAYDFGPDRIRVNCVAPGPVDTPLHATYTDDVEGAYADLARRVPLGRMGHVDDVAHWIWWLSATETTWTTGNVIHVDGGQVLGLPEAAGG
jgi:NAD(P)-dependent dehydrogenase (short-subunit alcohol dehydrogenase family)